MQNHTQSGDQATKSADGELISLAQLVRRTVHYKSVIVAVVGVVALIYLVFAMAIYVVTPTTTVAKLDVRLEFPRAELGEYPNRTKFSPAEIVATTVLAEVFEMNELAQFTTFDEFKGSVVVVTSNLELESLIRSYAAKLSAPALSVVERDQLEREFREKKESLSKADLSIQMMTTDRLTSIPRSKRAKILTDILSVWAEQTVNDKGVMLYDISVLSSGVFQETEGQGHDYIIALDVLRKRIDLVIETVDELLGLPGAKVLRTKTNQASLEELRMRLRDLQSFRIRPLVGTLISKGISNNPGPSFDFLQTQFQLAELERQEASERVAVIRDALKTYVEERQLGGGSAATRSQGPSADSIVSQIDDSFIDRLAALTANDGDLQFRQQLVDDLREQAMKVVPLETNVRQYRLMLDSFRGTARSPTEAERASIEKEIQAIQTEAVRMTDQVHEIYTLLSDGLNPSRALYSTSAPVSFSTTRAVSARILFLFGLLLLLVSWPVIVTTVLIYDRIRIENGLERATSQVSAPTEGS